MTLLLVFFCSRLASACRWMSVRCFCVAVAIGSGASGRCQPLLTMHFTFTLVLTPAYSLKFRYHFFVASSIPLKPPPFLSASG